MTNKHGKVYLVGAGPGDPKLITVRGMEILRNADVVVYDRLVNVRLLDEARSDAEMIFAGKRSGDSQFQQKEIEKLLIQSAMEGKTVCRLKGGDPIIFGRGGEEAEALSDAGIPFEIVPGITAGIAGPAYAGIPLTHRDLASSVAFVTGHEDPEKREATIRWNYLATGADTIVVFMGVETLGELTERLMKHGRDPATAAAVVQWATVADQKTVEGSLNDIASKCEEANLAPPALLIVGDVVRLREKLRWFDNRLLFGRRIVVTRASEQASAFVSELEALGAEVIEFPVVRICPLDSYERLDMAISYLREYDWIIFTSTNGVNFFMKRLYASGRDISLLAEKKIGAIGPATAQHLRTLGREPDFIPERFVAESIAEGLRHYPIAGQRILLPRAREAREALPPALEALGAHVDDIPVYHTELADNEHSAVLIDELKAGRIDVITFTSGSTVRNFVQLIGSDVLSKCARTPAVVSIGPITTAVANEVGLQVDIEAKEHTTTGIIEALCRHFGREQ